MRPTRVPAQRMAADRDRTVWRVDYRRPSSTFGMFIWRWQWSGWSLLLLFWPSQLPPKPCRPRRFIKRTAWPCKCKPAYPAKSHRGATTPPVRFECMAVHDAAEMASACMWYLPWPATGATAGPTNTTEIPNREGITRAENDGVSSSILLGGTIINHAAVLRGLLERAVHTYPVAFGPRLKISSAIATVS